jgi:hypothetical protein
MRFSKLQQFILEKCKTSQNKLVSMVDFFAFYSNKDIEVNKKQIRDIIHRSLDNLVAKDYLISFGRKTANKWFIEKVKLTAKGRTAGKFIIESKQKKLPLK